MTEEIKNRWAKYFKPHALTWWASFVPLLAGLIMATEPLHGWAAIVDALENATTAKPAGLITIGLIGIGLRGKDG